jgi:hypothetical protein
MPRLSKLTPAVRLLATKRLKPARGTRQRICELQKSFEATPAEYQETDCVHIGLQPATGQEIVAE